MKLFFFVLLGLAHATQPTNDYIKIKFRGAAIANVTPGTTAATDSCTGDVKNVVTVRVPRTTVTTAQIAADAASYGVGNDLVGACVNVTAAGAFTMNGTSKTASFSYSRHATSGRYVVVLNNAPFCQGTHADQAVGFQFDATNYACGGGFTGVTANDNDGVFVVGTIGYAATAMLYPAKKILAMQIMGPYTNAACHTAPSAAEMNTYPVVIPLETTALTATVDVSSTIGNTTQCGFDSGDSTAAATKSLIGYQTTTTKGELLLTLGLGTNITAYSDTTNTCTINADANGEYDSLKFSFGIRSSFTSCVQSTTTEGGDPAVAGSSRYFQLVVHPDGLGYIPNEADYPAAASCPEGTASPASNLHMSAFMAAAIAVMALFQ